MSAVMGASGCGKTTFMNAIATRAPYGNVEGVVKINGVVDGLEKAGNHVGFVPQDNIMHANLTVYQNLLYNALLRLPKTMETVAKEEQVARVIKVLGLSHVQDTLVGNEEKRGLSGGQKKRVNIGMELVMMPSILFMDEPTSGLDGAATIALARVLSLLRKSGITIICVIHQPRWAVFKEFTHLLLLGEGGRQVYCGEAGLLEPYFKTLGFTRPEGENPADWMIDVCCGLEPRKLADGTVDKEFECPRSLFAEWDAKYAKHALSPTSRWNGGDAARSQPVAAGNPLQRRPTLPLRTAVYYLTGRAFRQVSVVDLIFTVLTLIVVGIVLSVGNIISEFSWGGLPNRLNGAQLIYAIIIATTHRIDYGDSKVVLDREANSGISPAAIFFAMTIKTYATVFVKAFAFSFITYILASPLQNFVVYFVSWYGLTLWWAGTAQWVSLCTSQGTGTIILLFAPIFEALLSGDVGGDNEDLEGFTTRSLQLPSSFTIGRWNFQALYANEMLEYPEHVRRLTPVNQTLYWRYIPTEMQAGASAATGASFGFAWWNYFFFGAYLITFFLVMLLPANNLKAWRKFTHVCRLPYFAVQKCCGLCAPKGSARSEKSHSAAPGAEKSTA